MGKILISLCFLYPSAFLMVESVNAEGNQWIDARNKFDQHYNDKGDFPESGRQAIDTYCAGGWIDNLREAKNRDSYHRFLGECSGSINKALSSVKSKFNNLVKDLSSQQSLERTVQTFPENEEPIHNISDKIQKHQSAEYRNFYSIEIQRRKTQGIDMDTIGNSPLNFMAATILHNSAIVGLVHEVEQTPVMTARSSFLTHYKDSGCNEEGENASVSDCYDSTVAQKHTNDVQCIEKYGFEKCRPFLTSSKCQPKAVVDLASELSKDDKSGMAYICWKAAAQGAQCCINPDQCPTDGAFRNIASQLQKAAPGLVQAFAGLEAIKGNYQEACQANLMANAVGPLSQLQTKTCGDSATACEETCDKKVQDFKESFKKAVLGEQPQGKKQEKKALTIDEIVAAARAIHPDKEVIPDTEEAKIDDCSLAVAYLDKVFGKKEDDKKSVKLSEKLSHASLVDCGEEVFKYSGGSSSGGSGSGGANSASGLGGMNPMAAAACRQGHPSGPLPPRAPIVGPTPNPGMGPGHLFGSKTRRGLGGNFTVPGAGVPPGDEFIEPERGPSGANALNGGWTDTGGSGGGSGGSGSGGSGLPGSPSRDDAGGSGDTGDNLPIAYPEAFDSGGGGLGSGGGDMRPEQSARMQMAKYMERKDLEEARRKEEERKKKVDEQGSIFSRLSQTIRAYCQQENCSEE